MRRSCAETTLDIAHATSGNAFLMLKTVSSTGSAQKYRRNSRFVGLRPAPQILEIHPRIRVRQPIRFDRLALYSRPGLAARHRAPIREPDAEQAAQAEDLSPEGQGRAAGELVGQAIQRSTR